MRNRKYLIGVMMGLIGALALSGVASAKPIGQSLSATIAPAKQSKKTFGGVTLGLTLGTTVDDPATSQSPRTATFTIDPNIKFTNGNIPTCALAAIQGKFTPQALTACPQSVIGSGSVEVNNGTINGTATLFSGGPKTMYVQTDIGPGATSLTIVGQITGKILTFSNIPNTPGLILTKFAIKLNKRKTGKMKVKVHGKKKKVPTYYVMARCKKKSWNNAVAVNFYSGETLSATSRQKCKQKK